MNETKYHEILNRLNYFDFSSSIFPITLYDTKSIEIILKDFGYIPLGLKYRKRKDMYYKFTNGTKNYKIINFESRLLIIGV